MLSGREETVVALLFHRPDCEKGARSLPSFFLFCEQMKLLLI